MSLLGHCGNSYIVALDKENILLQCYMQILKFVKELRKANIGCARSVRLSVRVEQIGPNRTFFVAFCAVESY
jgi:hypothetical protein